MVLAVISALEGIAAGFAVGFRGAVSNFDFARGAFVAFGVIGAVFNAAVNALFGFAVCHIFHPFRLSPILLCAL